MLATQPETVRGPFPAVEPSSYLTDGWRLWRVLRPFEEPVEDSHALLEDCRTLEVLAFTPDELIDLGVKTVKAQPC